MTSKPVAKASKPTTVHATMTNAGGGAPLKAQVGACADGATPDSGSDTCGGGVKTDKGI
jgi:hypothetical protein